MVVILVRKSTEAIDVLAEGVRVAQHALIVHALVHVYVRRHADLARRELRCHERTAPRRGQHARASKGAKRRVVLEQTPYLNKGY